MVKSSFSLWEVKLHQILRAMSVSDFLPVSICLVQLDVASIRNTQCLFSPEEGGEPEITGILYKGHNQLWPTAQMCSVE